MTVAELREVLKDAPEDAKVFLTNRQPVACVNTVRIVKRRTFGPNDALAILTEIEVE